MSKAGNSRIAISRFKVNLKQLPQDLQRFWQKGKEVIAKGTFKKPFGSLDFYRKILNNLLLSLWINPIDLQN